MLIFLQSFFKNSGSLEVDILITLPSAGDTKTSGSLILIHSESLKKKIKATVNNKRAKDNNGSSKSASTQPEIPTASIMGRPSGDIPVIFLVINSLTYQRVYF